MDLIWPGVNETGTQIEPQFYPSCAQIEVESEAVSGELPKGIKIPEDVSKGAPGMFVPFLCWGSELMRNVGMTVSYDQYMSKKVDVGYVYPGGMLWDGEKMVEDKAPVM